MLSTQAACKATLLVTLTVIITLWATFATAGVNEDFIKAAKRGDLSEVKRLLTMGSDVNATDKDGTTALMLAAEASEENCRAIVEVLLAHGANVNAKDKNGQTALSLASKAGPKKVVELLRKARAK